MAKYEEYDFEAFRCFQHMFGPEFYEESPDWARPTGCSFHARRGRDGTWSYCVREFARRGRQVPFPNLEPNWDDDAPVIFVRGIPITATEEEILRWVEANAPSILANGQEIEGKYTAEWPAKVVIPSRIPGQVVYRSHRNTIDGAIEEAVRRRIPLANAELPRIDLGAAELARADLAHANLAWANLPHARLYEADLSGADLTGAILVKAGLTRARLIGTRLIGTRLTRAYLSGADLTGADLSGADLSEADLSKADLTGADLTWADLSRTDLTGTLVTREQLRSANLAAIRAEIERILGAYPAEVPAVRAALEAGQIRGPAHIDSGGSLISTLARIRDVVPDAILSGLGPGLYERAERWFRALWPGVTPANSAVAAVTADWLDEWLASR